MPSSEFATYPILTPGTAIDPMGALASSLHASRRLYAFLIGSGMSRAAGQPSAWAILDELIMAYAATQNVELRESHLRPTEWWEQTTREPADYSRVLAHLEPAPAGRQHRLATYFTDATPSVAHQHLATLCSAGMVQVILTTNFDRLIEDSLTDHQVPYQVITHSNSKGMLPLVRGLVTVIKINGDYLSLSMKNTKLELDTYPRAFARLLQDILRDFGLIVVGWSGQWDTALRTLLKTSAARNYPLYWISYHGDLSREARELLDSRGAAYPIAAKGANDFFTDLSSRLDALDRMERRRTSKARALRHGGQFPPDRFNPPIEELRENRLWIRTASSLGPAEADETGYIDPEERDLIREALNKAQITGHLRSLSIVGSVFGCPPEARNMCKSWELSERDFLSRDTAGFRLPPCGSRCDITARQWFQTPAVAGSGDNFIAICDVGINNLTDAHGTPRKLSLEEVAHILLDQFESQATLLTDTIQYLFPNGPTLREVEFHLYVQYDETKEYGTYRKRQPQEASPKRDFIDFIDLSVLGPQGRRSRHMSAALPISGPLTPSDQCELIIEAIRHIALSAGYPSPGPGIERIKASLLAR